LTILSQSGIKILFQEFIQYFGLPLFKTILLKTSNFGDMFVYLFSSRSRDFNPYETSFFRRRDAVFPSKTFLGNIFEIFNPENNIPNSFDL